MNAREIARLHEIALHYNVLHASALVDEKGEVRWKALEYYTTRSPVAGPEVKDAAEHVAEYEQTFRQGL